MNLSTMCAWSRVPTLIEEAGADATAIALAADLRISGQPTESILVSRHGAVGRIARELNVRFIDQDDERPQPRYTDTCRPRPSSREPVGYGRYPALTPISLPRCATALTA